MTVALIAKMFSWKYTRCLYTNVYRSTGCPVCHV